MNSVFNSSQPVPHVTSGASFLNSEEGSNAQMLVTLSDILVPQKVTLST